MLKAGGHDEQSFSFVRARTSQDEPGRVGRAGDDFRATCRRAPVQRSAHNFLLDPSATRDRLCSQRIQVWQRWLHEQKKLDLRVDSAAATLLSVVDRLT